jgi:probable HAF family extracellular repeat protein
MDMHHSQGLAALALALTAVYSAEAAVYGVKDLGPLNDLGGQNLSMPYAINSRGQMAAANVTNGAYRALLYGGAWTNLGTLGGGESLGFGLNEMAQVVGRSLTSSGLTRAFLWTPGGTNGVPGNRPMRDLGTLGGAYSEANAINKSGQITGFAHTGTYDHAFRYSGGTMTDIGVLLANLPNSYGLAINDLGHVVGVAYNKNFTAPRAFYYSGATAVDIGDLGGKGASALAINNRGEVAGYLTASNDSDRAFRYRSGVMTDLGTMGGNYSYAVGINNSNVVVGGSFIDEADTVYHAFIAPSNTLVDLNTQLDATGAGWTLVEARAINDAGQIAGVGKYGGGNRAFLLYLSAPRITGVKVSGTNVLVSFTTVGGGRYSLEAQPNLAGSTWSNVVTGLIGNGSTKTATNFGAASLPRRMYRVRLASP